MIGSELGWILGAHIFGTGGALLLDQRPLGVMAYGISADSEHNTESYRRYQYRGAALGYQR